MKNSKRTPHRLILTAALILALALCACPLSALADGDTVLENGGLTLTIPEEYAGLLLTETPEDSEDGILFVVTEKASVEAGQLEHPGEDWGDGWIFSIGRVDEDRMHEMLCWDMSGAQIFAENDGEYYVIYHPTDVRFVRESYEGVGDPDNESWQQWADLNEWAWTVPDAFIGENDGLTACSMGNSELDIVLNRIAYLEDVNYSLASLETGVLEPGDTDPLPYVERLLNGVTFEYSDEEAPDGEYIVLNLIDENLRFDFFRAADKGNYIREVFGDGYEILFLATYEDGETVARDIMQEWCDALAAE